MVKNKHESTITSLQISLISYFHRRDTFCVHKFLKKSKSGLGIEFSLRFFIIYVESFSILYFVTCNILRTCYFGYVNKITYTRAGLMVA